MTTLQESSTELIGFIKEYNGEVTMQISNHHKLIARERLKTLKEVKTILVNIGYNYEDNEKMFRSIEESIEILEEVMK